MEYSTFKLLQFVLFFAPVFIFGFWQLAVLRKLDREKQERDRGAAKNAAHGNGQR